MADLNKVFLIGNLTFDPELRRTPSGTAVSELRLATSRSWTNQAGERKEETLFIDVTVWDRQAENCCQYLKKGSTIHVEGSLKMDSWDDKATGEKRTKIKVHSDRVQFLDRREASAGSRGDDEYGGAPAREASPRRSSAPSMDSRGPGNGARGGFNGSSGAAPGASPRRPAASEPEPVGDEDEDIPF